MSWEPRGDHPYYPGGAPSQSSQQRPEGGGWRFMREKDSEEMTRVMRQFIVRHGVAALRDCFNDAIID